MRKRADHEAGHFIVAHALGIVTRPIWLTTEPRENSGGSCKLRRKADAPIPHTIQYYLGGFVCEAAARLWREYEGKAVDATSFQGVLTRAFQEALDDGGHGDNLRLADFLRTIPVAFRPNCYDLIWQTLTPVTEHQDMLFMLSDALLKYKTLYESAPLYLIAAHGKPEKEREHMLGFFDEVYWAAKQPAAEAPEGWFDGASEAQRAVPFYEGPVEFFQRNSSGSNG